MAIITDNFTGQAQEGLGLTVAIDYDGRSDSQPVFIGWAPPGSAQASPVWKIAKCLYDGSNRLTDRQWAINVEKKALFENAFTARASLTYA